MKDVVPVRWVSVDRAALVLDLTPAALRRSLERHAQRAPDGGVEANIDGVRARKFGRLWRVRFSERWLPTDAADGATLTSSRASTAKEK